jgi:hypothetical protein
MLILAAGRGLRMIPLIEKGLAQMHFNTATSYFSLKQYIFSSIISPMLCDSAGIYYSSSK